jgi:hypothetical protein
MPHVKFQGAIDGRALIAKLEPFAERDETGVRKVLAYYLEKTGESLLAESLVAAEGLPQRFFLVLQLRADAATLRCLPTTDPEKSPALRRLVASLGLRILAAAPGVALGASNLEEEIAALGGPGGG